jgi:flagellin-specific chaperone FliS
MEGNIITQEEVAKMANIFKEIRQYLDKYMSDRDFKMSNPQMFTFLMYAPVAFAIASDRNVDAKEIRLLDKITKDIDVENVVNIDLMELLTAAPEPSDIMLNEEFNMRIDAEMLYLSRNIDKYEDDIINALKKFLELDKNPESETSLSKTMSMWFDYVIEHNAGRDKEKELQKVAEYKKRIGLA